MTRYQVSFHVRVEVDAIDPTDAINRANIACGWPGDFSPPSDPVLHERQNSRLEGVQADVMRSQALMIKEVP